MEEIKYPKVGEELYLSQRTGDHWVDMVKWPYTVVEVKKGSVIVQEAQLIFTGPRYFDTLPVAIVPNEQGDKITLRWSKKKGRWQYNTPSHAGYPEYAFFGKYEYSPYLN